MTALTVVEERTIQDAVDWWHVRQALDLAARWSGARWLRRQRLMQKALAAMATVGVE